MILDENIKSIHYIEPKVKQSKLGRKIINYEDGPSVIVSANAKKEKWKVLNEIKLTEQCSQRIYTCKVEKTIIWFLLTADFLIY